MLRRLFRAVAVALVLLAVPPLAARAAVNPVFRQDFADPAVLTVGHRFFAYASAAAWQRPGGVMPILRSTDLVHWRVAGDALSLADVRSWSKGAWWAPSVIQRGATTYLFYNGADKITGHHCLAVATASHPTGPFTHRAVLTCGDGATTGGIDPAVFVDASGAGYLYYATDRPHTISVVPLSLDLLHVAGARTTVLTVTQPWEAGFRATVEAPSVFRRGERYYMLYSGNDWRGHYAMGVATAPGPLGPWTKAQSNPFLHETATVASPGGGSVFRDPAGRTWLAYHAWTRGLGYAHQGARGLRINPLDVTHGQVSLGAASP